MIQEAYLESGEEEKVCQLSMLGMLWVSVSGFEHSRGEIFVLIFNENFYSYSLWVVLLVLSIGILKESPR